ncbi:MAG TPA: hypothetical protein DDW42_00965 [Desulfobacteraceae bacterium]|nr:hypothetical protein [Desulfobacteraceae bacterium]
MLLSLMRKHAKSWLIKVLIGIIALVFVFYFGYSFTAKRALKMAFVNGELISRMEYENTYHDLLDSLQRKYKGVWNDKLIKVFNLKKRALDNLISQKLINQEAKRLGLDVTEGEVQKSIMDYPAFQVNGQFDVGRYRALLSNNRMKPDDFEASMAQDLLQDKLKQFLFAFMDVTDREVQDFYTFANEKIKFSFVQFMPENYIKLVKPDQASMKAFFEERKENYRIPKKIKVSYLVIDPDAFKDKAKVTDMEIKGYYEYHRDEFTKPKQIRASHILFKLKKGATEKEEKTVKERADKVLKEARQGKDFATLARKYSEGPTKKKGGDLGYFSSGRMEKPFETAAFKLKKGEISDLVRTGFGYHIIKLVDLKEAKTKTLEEVRDQIVKKLIESVTMELAHEKGLSLIDQMPYDVELSEYAAEHKLEAKKTDYFTQNEPIPGIGGDDKLRQSLFSLEKNETSELFELKGKFYIFQVADINLSYLAKMDEVVDKVKRDFTAYLAGKKAKSNAEDYLADLKNGKEWDKLAKEKNLIPEETKFFTRRDSIQKIGDAPGLQESAFGLNQDKRYPDKIFESNKGVFVIRWDGKKGIDEKKYQEESEKYRLSLIQIKHRRAFEDWLENLRKNAKIEIVSPETK